MIMGEREKTLNAALLKLLILALVVIFVMLQYRLWLADGNMRNVFQLKQDVNAQILVNDRQTHKNNQLRAEIHALKNDPGEIEARARKQLGLVKPEETYFMFVE